MEQEVNRSNLVWVDNARAISSILVIITHTLGPWVYQIQQFGQLNRILILTFFTISKLCTPTFLMISGSLLIHKDYNDLGPHKKRTRRLLNTFILWSTIYLVFYTLLNIARGQHYTLASYTTFVKESVLHGSAYHLWFMYLIIAVYLFMPLLSRLCKKISIHQFIIFFFIWGVSLVYTQFYELNLITDVITSTIGYIGYLLIGYIINKYNINEKIRIRYASIIFIIGILSTLVLAYTQFSYTHTIPAKTFHRLNFNIAFVSIGFFIMIKSFMYNHKLLRNISKNSFGIYYIHLFSIMILNKIWLVHNSKFMLINLALFAATTFILSYLLINFLERIKNKSVVFKNVMIA